MATTPKTTIGTMACLCCGHEIPVKQSENLTINAACQWCDFPAYAKKGTGAHRIILAKMKPNEAPAPTPQAPPATKTVATPPITKPPAPAPVRSPFHGL